MGTVAVTEFERQPVHAKTVVIQSSWDTNSTGSKETKGSGTSHSMTTTGNALASAAASLGSNLSANLKGAFTSSGLTSKLMISKSLSPRDGHRSKSTHE